MMRKHSLFVAAGAALLLCADAPRAQVNVQWVTFTKQPSKLALAPLVLSDNNTQVQFREADMDGDGDGDLVCMRKEVASLIGKRAAFLLLNIGGVLTNKTTEFATLSDVPGDQGFNTITNTRESALSDLDNDGWIDVSTSPTLSDGDPKHISHPRIYMNLGAPGGSWLGLSHEDARVPQLKTVGGVSVAPRFCGMGAQDVTNDGNRDIYFVDYDGTETGFGEAAGTDLNDRLLVNDGNGFFTDQSAARFTTTQLLSAFGADAEMIDVNDDGFMDIVKDTTLNNPTAVRILYNNPANPGNFQAMGVQDIGSNAPYAFDMGNLNNDGIMDAAIVDDGLDKFRFGTGYDALNKVIWGPLKNYTFVTGGDDGFGHTVFIRDLDGNGWGDVIITDVDGDLPGCQRRLHIYHNTGSVPGDMNLVIKEESEFANGGTGVGWKGVVGLTAVDLKGSFDLAFDDWDADGDLDFLLATCTGTNYWQNETNPVQTICQDDLGFAGPGNMELSVCGDDLTTASSVASLEVTGAAPLSTLFMVVGFTNNPQPLKGGTIVPLPIAALVVVGTNGAGEFTAPIGGGTATPTHVYMQGIVKNGLVYEFSNALDVLMGF
jgi:hypothetical protein